MSYEFFDHSGDVGAQLLGRTVDELFASAAGAFTDTITALDAVEPRRPEEVDLAAPDLTLLLVDFLSELLYRFDTRSWLTRRADLAVREADGGWTLEGTLFGERVDPARHVLKTGIKAVAYHGLDVRHEGDCWRASVVFDV